MNRSSFTSPRSSAVRLSVFASALVAAVLAASCASMNGDGIVLGNADDAGQSPTFTTKDDAATADAAEASSDVHTLACIGTECPAPWATCSTGPSFKCQTNLLNDPENCGACGVSCGNYDATNMASRCIQGACTFECEVKDNGAGLHQFANCNSLLDDGCEVDLSADHDNCGACGHACDEGENCIRGMCGCPSGKTDCNGECVDTDFDNANCGACGTVCPKPSKFTKDPCGIAPPHTQRGCGVGECGHLVCQGAFKDCDHDLGLECDSNGCESDTNTDPNNCGACGKKCDPGQECRNDGNGAQCVDPCEKSGLTQCPFGCYDLASDTSNCGACGNYCPLPDANQTSDCVDGLCRLSCLPGFADCNGNPADGCEIDLRSHPANCGACGNECDFGAGQPCIEGKCLMVECGTEVTK